VDKLCRTRFVISTPVTEVLGTVRRYYICRSNRCFNGPLPIKHRRRLPQSMRRQVLVPSHLVAVPAAAAPGVFLTGAAGLAAATADGFAGRTAAALAGTSAGFAGVTAAGFAVATGDLSAAGTIAPLAGIVAAGRPLIRGWAAGMAPSLAGVAATPVRAATLPAGAAPTAAPFPPAT
jgi:hypothetical protein